MYTIYLLTNILNGKQYVGFTNHLTKRLIQHKSASSRGSNYLIHKAIRKYGWENFKMEILFETPDREHALKIVEPAMITKYSTRTTGYNLTAGGEGVVRKHTKDDRLKMSQNHADFSGKNNPFSGKTHTVESKQKMSASLKGRSVWNKGKTLSEEHRMKLRMAKLGIKRGPYKKKVEVI